jgi:GT2 family glycosyltransferase
VDDQAVVAYLHPGMVRAEFMRSMLALDRGDVEAFIEVQAGPNLARWRNTVVRRFLDEHTAPWLWMVDTDMVFAPGALRRLIAAADPEHVPILGALCFSGDDDEQYSTMYELVEKNGQPTFARYTVWPENAVYPVATTGTGCLLVHRRVFEAVADHRPDPAAPWFREVTFGGQLMGEDMTFCMRAQATGIPVHVHTGVRVGHIKSTMIGTVR